MKYPLPLFILLSFPALAAAPQSLPIQDITAVIVTGDASAIDVTSDPGRPYRVSLAVRRSGWFGNWSSNWFYNSCRDNSRIWKEGPELRVAVVESTGFGSSDCTVELKVNMPASAHVSITQKAARVALTGAYGDVDLDLRAGDVTLKGDVRTVAVRGDAVRANLSFGIVEAVTVDVAMLDVFLGFAPGSDISYRVDAAASFVDSALPNTPGAKPSVLVRADAARATIR
ncbi:hypothetical protein ACFSM5_13735 [Lacibacterium aquatile]|uniref:Adhesin domain-containing protein n=1 Tax=Lacibacterium aquatile TaxID=1168082 RepID=A0ABW5DTG1_9PROT